MRWNARLVPPTVAFWSCAMAAGVLSTFLLLAWTLLDEPLGAATLLGGGLVLAAGVWVALREPPDARTTRVLGSGA